MILANDVPTSRHALTFTREFGVKAAGPLKYGDATVMVVFPDVVCVQVVFAGVPSRMLLNAYVVATRQGLPPVTLMSLAPARAAASAEFCSWRFSCRALPRSITM